MEPIRKLDAEPRPEGEADETQKVLDEIASDARSLKDRYAAETVVPEGGE